VLTSSNEPAGWLLPIYGPPIVSFVFPFVRPTQIIEPGVSADKKAIAARDAETLQQNEKGYEIVIGAWPTQAAGGVRKVLSPVGK
jgi:hypothetical protein